MISFIIVNYNCWPLVLGLVANLESTMKGDDYEIVIVDNASTDESKETLTAMANKRPNLIYIYNDHNYGFGKANNIGVKHASGEMVVIINPDVKIERTNFGEFIRRGTDGTTGAFSPELLYLDGSRQVAGGRFSTIATFMLQEIRLGYHIRKYNLQRHLVWFAGITGICRATVNDYVSNLIPEGAARCSYDWISGACMILRRDVFQKVGGFDENFFMYVEDEDLCRRIRALGFEIYVDRRFTIVHLEGGTQTRQGGRLGKAKRSRYFSNLYYQRKYSGKCSEIALRLFYVLALLISSLRFFICGQLAASGDRLSLLWAVLLTMREDRVQSGCY